MKKLIFSVLLTMMAVFLAVSVPQAFASTNLTTAANDLTIITFTGSGTTDTQGTAAYATMQKTTQGQDTMQSANTSYSNARSAIATTTDNLVSSATATTHLTTAPMLDMAAGTIQFQVVWSHTDSGAVEYTENTNVEYTENTKGSLTGSQNYVMASVQTIYHRTHTRTMVGRTSDYAENVAYKIRV